MYIRTYGYMYICVYIYSILGPVKPELGVIPSKDLFGNFKNA